jgi:hypothetical protein
VIQRLKLWWNFRRVGARVFVLRVLPGDVLVIQTDRILSRTQMDHIGHAVSLAMPGTKTMVFDEGLRVAGVIAREAVETA